MALALKSEYLCSLSAEAKLRYESKVISSGLNLDPYTIKVWTQDPETVPSLQWSDVMLYMVSTPSPYTKEAIKVLSMNLIEYSIV